MTFDGDYLIEHATKRITKIYPVATPGISALGDVITELGTVTSTLDQDGLRNLYQTTAVSGNDAGISGLIQYRRDQDIELFARFSFFQTSLVRLFIGLSNQTLATMVGADNPAGHYFGLQYSTPRADANFKVVRKDGTTQTLVNDIGIDGNLHLLYMWLYRTAGANKVILQLDDGTRNSFTTLLPDNTTGLRFIAGVETQTAGVKAIDIGKILIAQVF